MDFMALQWQIFRGSLAKRLFLRALLFTLGMMIISFVQMANDLGRTEPFLSKNDQCPLDIVGSNPYVNLTGVMKPVSSFAFRLFATSVPCEENDNLTRSVFKELMEKRMLASRARVVCVGEGAASAVVLLRDIGVLNAIGVHRHPFFSLWKKRFVYELDLKDSYFDFVFSRSLDRVSVPALLVLEIERILRPGGIGAMLVGAHAFYSGSLVRSATPVSSFLKSSDVVHVCRVGSFTLVIFKKRFDNVNQLEHYRLPDHCPSITNNKPFLKHIEPLAGNLLGQHKSELSFLPKFMNISSRNRLVYINIGASELVSSSITEILEPYHRVFPRAFDAYLIDHNTSTLSSYVRKPGVTFVYHPGLLGNYTVPILASDEHLSAPTEENGFEFAHWFQQSITTDDFVVLMMNARAAELKILFELYETGAICRIDELFIHCSDAEFCKDAICGDCRSLFKGLRKGGVFVHQWWEPGTVF